MTGDPHVAIAIAGDKQDYPSILELPPILRVQPYVPSGAQTITLDDASSFAAGDTIRITRFTTPNWLHFMGMDGMVRDGKPETWVGRFHPTPLRTVAEPHRQCAHLRRSTYRLLRSRLSHPGGR